MTTRNKSRDAAKLDERDTQRQKVFNFIKSHMLPDVDLTVMSNEFLNKFVGATDEEIQIGLGIKSDSETPRRIELFYDMREIIDSGYERKTRLGNTATVWVTKDFPPEKFGPCERSNPNDRQKSRKELLERIEQLEKIIVGLKGGTEKLVESSMRKRKPFEHAGRQLTLFDDLYLDKK